MTVTKNNAVMHRNLGNALDWTLNGEEALFHLQRAVEIDPDRERTYTTLARFYRQRGDWKHEVIHLQKSLLCKPGQPALLNRLAYILAAHPEEKARRGKEAMPLVRRAGELVEFQSPLYLHTWVAAEIGDFAEAIRLTERAMEGKSD